LIIGKGATSGVWSSCSVDDIGGIAIQGVGGGTEGVGEVFGFAHLRSIQSRSFEARWKVGDVSIVVEVVEKVGS